MRICNKILQFCIQKEVIVAIRLVRLVLDGTRNVGHGEIDFEDLPQGGSVTGIYGQNGSGKTTVIDAIGVLRHLLAGEPLDPTSGDIVSADAGRAAITATWRIGDGTDQRFLEYRAELAASPVHPGRAKVTGESVRIGATAGRLGRAVLTHRREEGEFVSTPAYVWRSIMRAPSVRAKLTRTEEHAYMEGRSFLFSRLVTLDDEPGEQADWAVDWAVRQADASADTSARVLDYFRRRLGEFTRLRAMLQHYATHDIFVSTTRRSATAAYAFIPILEEDGDDDTSEFMFDLLKPVPLTGAQTARLERTVESFDRILPTIVPGLHIRVRKHYAGMGEDGEDRIDAELLSVRDHTVIPFRCESEGIIRITALLGYLRHAYVDGDALVAIDEFDSGVFELLLGDMLVQIADGCEGQLVFTAHNLRAMEVLPDSCIRTTLTDPGQRFATIGRRSASNNQRKRYLTISEFGWDRPDVYDRPQPRMFGNSLLLAGRADTDGQGQGEEDR